MKKRNFVLFISILMLLSMTLSSCLFVKNADSVYKKIDRAMSKLQSYKTEIELNVEAFPGGSKVTTSATGQLIEAASGKDDYYYYEKMLTKVTMGSKSNEVTSVEAFYDGNHYMSNRGLAYDQAFYSESTAEEFLEYRKRHADSDLEFNECENKELGEDDNGNTMLTFSGYSEESVDALCESYGFNRDDFLSEIKDMKVVMTLDKKYHAKEINVSFVFGEAENNKEPAFTLTMSYSDYNEAELITDSLNKDRFTKIDDVKILRDVTKLFEDCLEKSECKFTSKIDQNVSSNNGKSEQSEESDVKFYNGEDGFAYSVEAKADKTKVYLDYADGILKTKVGAGNPTSSKQSEEKAREYIANLLGQTAYNPLFVTDAKKDGDSYVLTLGNADISELKSLFSTSGGKLSNSSYIMTITVVDGEVTKIKTNIRLDGMLQTWTIITVDKTIEFYE